MKVFNFFQNFYTLAIAGVVISAVSLKYNVAIGGIGLVFFGAALMIKLFWRK